jgi:hypothetical protein
MRVHDTLTHPPTSKSERLALLLSSNSGVSGMSRWYCTYTARPGWRTSLCLCHGRLSQPCYRPSPERMKAERVASHVAGPGSVQTTLHFPIYRTSDRGACHFPTVGDTDTTCRSLPILGYAKGKATCGPASTFCNFASAFARGPPTRPDSELAHTPHTPHSTTDETLARRTRLDYFRFDDMEPNGATIRYDTIRLTLYSTPPSQEATPPLQPQPRKSK